MTRASNMHPLYSECDAETYKALSKACKEYDRSKSWMVSFALSELLKELGYLTVDTAE